jgi:hypothetical protein
MDESVYRNLDTQHRMLADLERVIDNELAAGPEAEQMDLSAAVPFSRAMTYRELTDANDIVRARREWNNVDLYAALSVTQQVEFVEWLAAQRLPWTPEDLLVLGFAGAVGAAATIFDTEVDRAVRKSLELLKKSGLIQRWEDDARRLPIDYTGKGVGGPSHRVKSAGHDLGRPLEALRQIREGVFRGTAFPHGAKTAVNESLSNWQEITSWPEAMILWAKHLAADVVTPMSLPLPGFTKLYELDHRSVREFAHAAYQGQRPFGNGLNVRSGMITPTLSVLSTEAIIRSHMLMRAHRARGTVELTAAERGLQTELLLAGHGLVGAVALGKATTILLLSKNPAMAVRHINTPVLMRVGSLGLAAVANTRERSSIAAPSWDALLKNWAQPWQLDAAFDVEREAERLKLASFNPTETSGRAEKALWRGHYASVHPRRGHRRCAFR